DRQLNAVRAIGPHDYELCWFRDTSGGHASIRTLEICDPVTVWRDGGVVEPVETGPVRELGVVVSTNAHNGDRQPIARLVGDDVDDPCVAGGPTQGPRRGAVHRDECRPGAVHTHHPDMPGLRDGDEGPVARPREPLLPPGRLNHREHCRLPRSSVGDPEFRSDAEGDMPAAGGPLGARDMTWIRG